MNPIDTSNYTPEEMATLQRIRKGHEIMNEAIDKLGMEAAGAAFLIAAFKAFGWDDEEL